MSFKLADDNASEFVVVICVKREEAKLWPLVEEVAVHVDTVGLGEVFRNEFSHLRKILFLLVQGVLNVSYAWRGHFGRDIGSRIVRSCYRSS